MIHVKETASRLILTGDKRELDRLSTAYRIQPPDYWRSPRYDLYKRSNGERGWDGYLYPLKRPTSSTGILARGHLEDLKEKSNQFSIQLNLDGVLPPQFSGLTVDDVSADLINDDRPAYDHQVRGVIAWLQRSIGINQITVSGGKTMTFCLAASLIKRKKPKARVLYLVPTERLVKQVFAEAQRMLPDWDITQYGGGKKDNTGADMVVATYAVVHRNFKELDRSGWLKSFSVLEVDECIPGYYSVETESGTMRLDEMVQRTERGESVFVKSISENGKFELRKVVRSWRKGERECVVVKLSYGRIECTPYHKILTTRGWKKSCCLTNNDFVVCSPTKKSRGNKKVRFLNYDQEQVLIGSYLGDGSIDWTKKSTRIVWTHGIKQEDYAKWKGEAFCSKQTYIHKNGYCETPAVRVVSTTFCTDIFLQRPKTRCERSLISKIEALALAIWFMDDGSCSFRSPRPSIRLATCSFDATTHELLIEILWLKFGIKSCTRMAREYPYIAISSDYSEKFLDIVRPFAHSQLAYKFWKEIKIIKNHELNSQFVDAVKVESISMGRKYNVYDIEVEKNHNFIIKAKGPNLGYDLDHVGITVHNCHHAKSPSLCKIIESIPAFFKFGATDSAKEDDPVNGFKIRGLLGPVLTKMEAGKLIDDGKLAKPLIYLVDVHDWHNRCGNLNHSPAINSPAWAYVNSAWKKGTYLGPAVERDDNGDSKVDKHGEPIKVINLHRLNLEGTELDVESRWCLLDRSYDGGIIRFKPRNTLITEWAAHFSKQMERTLVVCTRTLHVMILQHQIEEKIGSDLVRILFSEHSTKQRDETFDWFKKTPGSVLITPLVKEGVSIHELSAGIVADYVGTHDVARQLIGRFIRKKFHREENSAKIVWFIERQVPSYRRGSLELFKELERNRGFEFYYPVAEPGSEETALRYAIASVSS